MRNACLLSDKGLMPVQQIVQYCWFILLPGDCALLRLRAGAMGVADPEMVIITILLGQQPQEAV